MRYGSRLSNVDPTDVDRHADLGRSGVSDDREQFNQLLDAIEADEYTTHVVCWEISRLSRTGATLHFM